MQLPTLWTTGGSFINGAHLLLLSRQMSQISSKKFTLMEVNVFLTLLTHILLKSDHFLNFVYFPFVIVRTLRTLHWDNLEPETGSLLCFYTYVAVPCASDCFLIEWLKTQSKVITPTNHSRRKQRNEPIRFLSKCMQPAPNAGKMRACKSQLVLVQLLIGWKSGASFANQSQSEVKQNQTKQELLWNIQFKTTPVMIPSPG